MCKEPASSNLIPRGNNSSSESEGEKRGELFLAEKNLFLYLS